MNNLSQEIKDKFSTVIANLKKSAVKKRLGQAYLLVGDDSDSLLEITYAISRLATCSNLSSTGESCGVCSNCQKLLKHKYYDMILIKPMSKSCSILTEQIDELMNKLSLTISKDKKKIGVILDADSMVLQAQNAFLKTLEEPDQDTLLILCTTKPKLLLPTIKSRCQVISFLENRIEFSEMAQLGLFDSLAKLTISCDTSIALAVASELRVIMKSLMDKAKQESQEERKELQKDWNNAQINSAVKQQIKVQSEAAEQAQYLQSRDYFLAAIQTWFQQLELISYGIDKDSLPHQEIFANKLILLQPLPVATVIKMKKVLENLTNCFSSNANEGLAIDAFCLEVSLIS